MSYWEVTAWAAQEHAQSRQGQVHQWQLLDKPLHMQWLQAAPPCGMALDRRRWPCVHVGMNEELPGATFKTGSCKLV